MTLMSEREGRRALFEQDEGVVRLTDALNMGKTVIRSAGGMEVGLSTEFSIPDERVICQASVLMPDGAMGGGNYRAVVHDYDRAVYGQKLDLVVADDAGQHFLLHLSDVADVQVFPES